jgi:FtsH-binding integral membrane protein
MHVFEYSVINYIYQWMVVVIVGSGSGGGGGSVSSSSIARSSSRIVVVMVVLVVVVVVVVAVVLAVVVVAAEILPLSPTVQLQEAILNLSQKQKKKAVERQRPKLQDLCLLFA